MTSVDRTIALYAALLVLLTWLLIRGIIPGWTRLHSDFGNYYVSARLVSEGANLDSIYSNEWFHRQMVRSGVDTPGKFSPFPPITAWMLIPLSSLQPLTAQRISVITNLIFIIICAHLWRRVTNQQYLSAVVLVVAGGASISNNIAFGQVYLVMTSCVLFSFLLIEQGRLLFAGVIIGLFAALKYFPVVIIAGLFFLALVREPPDSRRYQLTVVNSLITLCVLILAQWLFFGPTVMREYFMTAFLPHLSSELSGQGMYSHLFQSWDSLARNIFVFDPIANPDPILDWSAGRQVLKSGVAAAVLISSGLVMYRYSSARPATQFNVFLAIPALAMLVLLPASATYHFVLLLLPMALLVREEVLSPRTKTLIIVVYVIIGFLPLYTSMLGFLESPGLLLSYPRLWLITLLFAVVVWRLMQVSKQTVIR